MQINTNVCDLADDSFEYFNTCKSPVKWISTCLITNSPIKRDTPLWSNYTKTFRGYFISNTEELLNVQCVSKNICNAITIQTEKNTKKITSENIKDIVMWCCHFYPSIPDSIIGKLIKQFTQFSSTSECRP